MSTYKAKTIVTSASVSAFISSLTDEQQREDSHTIVAMMTKQSGFKPKMWGTSIIGFGNYDYKYASGHEGVAPIIAFSPRKTAISLYLSCSMEKRDTLLADFGKHKRGKACIYIKRLSDINREVLEKMIAISINSQTGT